MLLTLTTTAEPATDLGFLLHKHPDRTQTFPVAPGSAHVFYPRAEERECTDWLLLDAELLPWSVKAGGLIREQYAAVGAAAAAGLAAADTALGAAAARGVDVGELAASVRRRVADTAAFRDAYRRYCWPTDGPAGVQLAPFQMLAAEGAAFHMRPHDWHLGLADRLHTADPEIIRGTATAIVDTTDEESVATATAWWEKLTAEGGEGMVVKLMAGLVRGTRGLVQPGVKVRGREYLRLIYGPDYTAPEHLDRLRQRGLGRKRVASPCASTRSVWRRWSGWPATSRCGGCTSASSRCWLWSPSRWTRACDGPGSRPERVVARRRQHYGAILLIFGPQNSSVAP